MNSQTTPDASTASPESRLLTPLWIIAAATIVAALYVGRLFLVPIVFAILLSIICRPIVRIMHRRFRIPATATAALLVLGIIGVIVGGSFLLIEPIQRWWDNAEASFKKAEGRLSSFGAPLQKLTEMKDRLDHIGAATTVATPGPTTNQTTKSTGGPAGATTSAASESNPDASATSADSVVTGSSAAPAAAPTGGLPTAAPASSSRELLVSIFGGVSAIVGGASEVLFLAFLILSTDGMFLHKFRSAIDGIDAKSDAGSVVHEASSLVLRYLLVSLVIAAGQAVAVAIALKLLGFEHVLLWGVLTMVLEMVPYLGAAVMISLLTITALAAFDSIGHAALVPASYLLISNIQNNIVSPLLYGNHLKLNAPAIFVGVVFFWFVWGIPGAFVAVPILAIARLACEKSARLAPFGSFLADDTKLAEKA